MRKICLILAWLLLAVSPAVAAERSDAVRFVVWGDSQFANMGVFERLVHETELLRPDFVIQVGDLINGYTPDKDILYEEWRVYKAQTEALTVPFYPVPGNHDVVTPESEVIYGEIWGTDKYYYSFDYGPAHMIVLDSFWQEEHDRIMPWQLEWLRADLEAYAEKHGGIGSEELDRKAIFLFMHSPIWRYDTRPGGEDWKAMHEILKPYPVKMVFGGHTHEYVWEEHDGIEYVVLNSSGSSPQNERGGRFFSQIHISVTEEGDTRAAVIKTGSILPLDTVNSEERETIAALALEGGVIRIPSWNEGEAIDTTVEVPLKNELDYARLMHVAWHVPFGANVSIEPASLWVEVGAEETVSIPFQVRSSAAPAEELRPHLTVSTTENVRTGVVSREWERVYTERAQRAAAGERVSTSNIPLEQTVTYDARFDFFVPPVATAARRKGQVLIDGSLDEKDWENAPIDIELKSDDGIRTRVQFLYDDDFLYVGAWMEEPNPAGLVAKAEGDIPLTWNDDDLELFFDTTNEGKDRSRLFINYVGTRFNSYPISYETDPEFPDRNKYFKSDYTSAIEINEDHWIVEMQVPWSDIWPTKQPQSGDQWSINVGRHRPQSDPKQSRWSGGLYAPARYGILMFE